MSSVAKEGFTRYDQKLEFILRTAARIFADKSYHSTTMRDISRATEVSLAGLYYYCSSKEELLYLIQDNCFGRVLERLEQRLGETHNAVEKLRVLIENHLSFFAANMAEMKVLSHEADSLAGDRYDQVSGKKKQYTTLARRILEEVQLVSSPDARARVDLTVATYALFGMMNWMYNWYDPRGKISVAELVENLTRIFMNGFMGEVEKKNLSFAGISEMESLSVWREA
ncbi:MAG: TetR/AcrR family transcriptional regulator [Pyrinomonadaceae bacterium]